MALTKTTTEDRIEVVGDFKLVHLRTATIIKEDGTELSRTFARKVLDPGDLDKDNKLVDRDISSESSEVQTICNTVWTADIKEAWRQDLVSRLPPGFSP